MASIQATRLKKGMLIKLGNDLFRVLDLQHFTPGNKRGFVQARMRNIRNGQQADNKFRAEEDVERAHLDERQMQYLYRDGDSFHFMDTNTYEQIHLDAEVLGDNANYILPEMVITMEKAGMVIECHHHEVATGGQAEIDQQFKPLVKSADWMMIYKYVIRNVAHQYGKTVTFMPKPLFQDNGSGMHTHQSLWKEGKPLFAGDKYAGLSQTALWYIGGLLKHAPALAALIAPTTNSYKRLVPGFEAPVNLAYSRRNRSAAVRIPLYSASAKAKRVEFRPPDPSCNAYLAFAGMMMAGLDGIENKIDPGEPLDKDIYDLGPEELKRVPSLPGSLEESLRALEKDHDFLLKGDVFSEELLETWIDYKMKNEVQAVGQRPHPYEFALYYDI